MAQRWPPLSTRALKAWAQLRLQGRLSSPSGEEQGCHLCGAEEDPDLEHLLCKCATARAAIATACEQSEWAVLTPQQRLARAKDPEDADDVVQLIRVAEACTNSGAAATLR